MNDHQGFVEEQIVRADCLTAPLCWSHVLYRRLLPFAAKNIAQLVVSQSVQDKYSKYNILKSQFNDSKER